MAYRSITLDERRFHEPRAFKPERFLPKPEGYGEVFPTNPVFGWGRRSAVYYLSYTKLGLSEHRICPGRFLADDTVWLAIVRTLAAFNINKKRDAQGNIVEPIIRFVSSVTRSVLYVDHAGPLKLISTLGQSPGAVRV